MKVIAALCMLIDHIGLIFYPLDLRWRIIGRLAMPIFAYGVARGAFYTSSIKRYMKKMLLFSVASQIPFWGMRYLDGGQAFFTLNLNIGFTFWIALWCIAYLQKIGYKPQLEEKEEMLEVARQSTVETNKKVCTIVVVLASILLADVLGCDYSSYGVLVVIMGYFMFLRSGSLPQMALFYLILTALFFSQSLSLCLMQSMGVIAYGIIYGTRHLSEKRWSRFFYWFYPLHMVLLGVIRWLQLYR